ncbi:DUF695 domain-containing protein [Flavobacterium undicola]|uniref:DUF695 domain-containing protein n=1 Tax=Flavobacterium undicola TaxID=1932779 RepID=UPI0013786D6F|nr:DUF695 domain-containing protein [Flavobacterium undicola]MBA0884065.1 DUF695 domain-containing protein [Flavobacterium undicola]
MNFIKSIFRKKDEPIKSYSDFWNWFQKNEKVFFEIVKNHNNIEKGFFNKLSPKLEELKEGFFFLTGMYNNETAELIITVDGNIKNVVFAEELIASAPKIEQWRFTALKPSSNINDTAIKMADYTFNSENIYFYDNELNEYPDEIDITIIHNDLNQENRTTIINGTYIFIENYLGELDFINNIDKITIIGKPEAQKELVPITKLKDFLIWRQKEFIEKYEGVRYNTENDNYIALEAELENGNKLLAVINDELLNWNNKASHPWIAIFKLKYNGKNNNGMPNDNDYKTLNEIEEEIMQELKDFDGYLNIGRETANGEREIYFACKDFRQTSKVFFNTQQKYSMKFQIDYHIYKDKYWQSFKRYN